MSYFHLRYWLLQLKINGLKQLILIVKTTKMSETERLNRKGEITLSVVIITSDNWLFQTKEPDYFNYLEPVKVTKKR